MGTGKKEANRRVREGKTADGNIRVKGENFYRTAKKVKQLNVYKEGRAQRDKDGNITKAAAFQSRDVPTAVIEPNRKWFTNSRVISQESLSAFRTAMAEQAKDPNQFLLKSAKLPLSLIRDDGTNGVGDAVSTSKTRSVLVDSFADVFGAKATRKRVTMKNFSTVDDLADSAQESISSFHGRMAMLRKGLIPEKGAVGEETDYVPPEVGSGHLDEGEDDDDHRHGHGSGNGSTSASAVLEPVFTKGQSRRIWNELYRTIDSSDVIIHVLDARDPLGTTCRSIQDYLRKEAPHKHLIYILNKCDLVPSSVAARWVKTLQKTVPTCAFRASVTNPFGKGSLISLLRQFSSLHADRKQISVGLVGYPNVGKSSVLNALLGKKTCNVAPIPGETKVWQFVRLMKRIYLIDCPGIVPPDQNASPEDILLRGAVRTEKIYNPAQYIPGVIKRTKKHHLARTYEIKDWDSPTDFLEQLARKRGRLLSGGEADVDGTAIIVLNDFLRGKIPWFSPPPDIEGDKDGNDDDNNGRAGRLGEMPRKRKHVDVEKPDATSQGPEEDEKEKEDKKKDEKEEEDKEGQEDGDDFEGFGTDSAPSLSDSDSDDLISLGSISDEDSDVDAEEDQGEDEDKDDQDKEEAVTKDEARPVKKSKKAKGDKEQVISRPEAGTRRSKRQRR